MHPQGSQGCQKIRNFVWNTYIAGLLLNFAHLISQFGMIPNGGRCYYVNRSQPPLFIQMVKEYEKDSGDTDFVKSIMPLMVEEFNYWQSNHLGQKLLFFLPKPWIRKVKTSRGHLLVKKRTILNRRLCTFHMFLRNKTFLFDKIKRWKFQHLFDLGFHETSQNISWFEIFHSP